MNPIHTLVNNLMRAYSPDMERRMENDNTQVEGFIIKNCYSVKRLESMVGSELASKIGEANSGTPLWVDSVRNYLIAWAEN